MKSVIFQVPVLETPDGPVFESNAIARYGNTIDFPSPSINFRVLVKVLYFSFLFVAAVTRLKADNPLFGSSLIIM